MNAIPNFKLSREAALALLVSSALPGAAGAAQVARVQFATGQVSATGTDGKARPLGRGATIVEGDTVNTEQGRAQLQFVDGASVSLQPRTTFRIDEFRFSGKNDGQERGFFSLVRGGLRTITGLVGRDNRSAYRVTTSTATIGIRGTEYLADVTGSLRVAVGGGTIAIQNQAGTFIIEQGQSAYVANQNSTPVITFEKPLLPPPGVAQVMSEVAGALEVLSGERQDEPAVVISPAGVSAVGAFGLDASLFLAAGKAEINSTGQLVTFTDPSTGERFQLGSASVKNSFFDGIVGVGRWSDGSFTASVDRGDGLVTFTVPVGANQGLQYAYSSMPTAAVPTSAIATYSQLAATQATSTTGALGLGTFAPGQGTGQPIMAVDFATGKVGMDFSVTFPAAAYRVQTSGGIGGLHDSEVSLLGPAASFVFANSSPIPTMAIGGTACTGGLTCSTDVLGFLAGTTGERTGFTYEIVDPSRGVNIHGAAAGAQSELYLPIATSAIFAAADAGGSFRTSVTTGTGHVTPTGRMTMYSGGSGCCEFVSMGQGTAAFAAGETGFDGTIGFGRLTNGAASIDGGEGIGFVPLTLATTQGLHYVFGSLTSPMPASGLATYNLQGATKATSESGALGLGTFSGSLAVDFALGRIGMAFNVNFGGGNVYTVTTTGGVTNVRTSEVSLNSPTFSGGGIPTSNPASCCSSCSTSVNGLFAGAGAARAGFGYSIFDSSETVVGAATFAQTGLTPAPAGGALVGTNVFLNYAGAHDLGTFGSSDAFKFIETFGAVDSTGNIVTIVETVGITTIGTATPAPGETGNDGTIGWSRWVNGTLGGFGSGHSGGTISGTQSFHNVYGTPTSVGDMAALAGGAVTATYNLLGATKPTTDAIGATPGTLTSASLTANFGAGTVAFNAALNVNALNYTMSAGALPISGSGFGGAATTVGTGCASGCTGSVAGFFAGAMAARAGVAYSILNGAGNHVNGAIALTKVTPP